VDQNNVKAEYTKGERAFEARSDLPSARGYQVKFVTFLYHPDFAWTHISPFLLDFDAHFTGLFLLPLSLLPLSLGLWRRRYHAHLWVDQSNRIGSSGSVIGNMPWSAAQRNFSGNPR